MLVFMAGASTTVPVKARYRVVRKSCASPCAKLAMRFGGGGRDDQNFVILRDADVLHGAAENALAGAVLAGPETSDDFPSGERGKREGLDEFASGIGHDDLDRAAAFAEGTGEFRRLVRSNTAADAERDFHLREPLFSFDGFDHAVAAVSSYFTRPRRTSSIEATVGFLDVLGRNDRAPFCNWRARLAATMMKRYVLCSKSSGMNVDGASRVHLFLNLCYSKLARIDRTTGSTRIRRTARLPR